MKDSVLFLRIGCGVACLAVVIGAFGAHALSARLKKTGYAAAFETGVQYQFYHVLPHFVIAWLLSLPGAPRQSRMLKVIGGLFGLGTVLFSGSLYALAVSGVDIIGMITPIGGTAFIVAWLMLMCHAPDVLQPPDVGHDSLVPEVKRQQLKDSVLFLRIGCAVACLAVVIGAFGAHALGDRLKKTGYAAAFETGVQYQFYHVLPHFVISWLLSLPGADRQRSTLKKIGGLFGVGTLLFSGSLYVLAVSGVDIIGAITPLGGTAFIIAWLMLMCHAPAVLQPPEVGHDSLVFGPVVGTVVAASVS